jgi:SNF2 family DNA or RNA helicase
MDMRKSAMAKAIGKVLPPARSQMYQEMFVQNKDTIVKMINENTKKTIIFTTILDVADVIYKTLSAEGIGVLKVIGETGNRQEIFDSFRSDDRYDVLVATSQTLSTGVTLNVANQVMFFAVPWRAADYEQAYSRCYRINSIAVAL